jgi:putative SOS response-associated peptidase YedK
MCGRFVSPSERAIEAYWQIGRANMPPLFERTADRYNVAPQQGNPDNYIPIVRRNDSDELEVARVQWWLLPAWNKGRLVTFPTFNARVESIKDKPAFRDSLKFRRCVIPAKGWYEWQELKAGNLPWYLHGARNEEIIHFAGLWARWTDRDSGEMVESCAVIAGPANRRFWDIHDRMPFVLDRDTALAWMDRGLTDPERALALLKMNPDEAVAFHRVGMKVNKADPDNQGAELAEALSPEDIEREQIELQSKARRSEPAQPKVRKPKLKAPAGPGLFDDEPPF